MLTGLSSPKFNDAILSIRAIEDMFRRQVADGNMEVWVPSTFQGHLSIDVGNRYFTPRQHALQDRQVSFSPAVDPDYVLTEAMGDEFVHTEDNTVEYYIARKDAKGTKWVMNYQSTVINQSWKLICRHEDTIPNAIRIGDIVEAQISFVGIRLKGNRMKMALVLRAITMLDKGARDVSLHISPDMAHINKYLRMLSMQGQKQEPKNLSDRWPWKEGSVTMMMKKMMKTRTCQTPLGWRLTRSHNNILNIRLIQFFIIHSLFFYFLPFLLEQGSYINTLNRWTNV
jgi:hypothetical protein